MILLVAVILLIRLWLVFAVNVPVNVDTALMLKNFRVDLPTLAFIGLAETVVVVFLVHKWLKNNWATLGIAASPWLMTITIFHVWLGGALVGLGLVLAYKKWWSWILGLSIIYSSLFLASSSFQRLLENNLLNQITQAKLSEEVDLIQKNNFLATEKSYILPSLVRKVLYNKATLASSKIASKAVSLIDFEQGSAPLKAWVLTGMSGLPPKGVTPLVFYWEIPFIVIGGVVLFNRGVRKRYLLMFLMLALPAIIFDKKFLVVSGAGMLFFVVGLTSTGLTRVKHPLLKILVCILYLVSGYYALNDIYNRQDDYRYSDAKLYYETAKYIKNNTSNRFVVTNRFGPMEQMLEWYGTPIEKVTVREFNLSKESPMTGTVYIGTPKEISTINEQAVVYRIDADNELVYGYGKGLWIAKY